MEKLSEIKPPLKHFFFQLQETLDGVLKLEMFENLLSRKKNTTHLALSSENALKISLARGEPRINIHWGQTGCLVGEQICILNSKNFGPHNY